MKKNKTNILLLLLLFSASLMAQNGMPKWAFPSAANSSNSSKLLDVTPGTLSNLPNGPDLLYDYQGQVPKYAFNNFTDDNGDLLFFVVDNKVFDKDGYIMATFHKIISDPSASYSYGYGNFDMGSQISIINVPGECNKYYIMFYNYREHPSGSVPIKRGYYYLTIDLDAPSILHPNRTGSITQDHSTVSSVFTTPPDITHSDITQSYFFAKPILLASSRNSNASEVDDGHTISVTNINNNMRFVYFSGKNNVARFRVTSQGFVNDNYDLNAIFTSALNSLDLFQISFGNGVMIDEDIVRLSNGNYRLAVPIIPGSGGWTPLGLPSWTTSTEEVYVLVLTINGQTGAFSSHVGIKFPKVGATFSVKGLEFSENGNVLYISNNSGSHLYHANVSQASSGQSITATPLSVSNASAFKNGNIERGLNNVMYFAKANGIGTLSNSNLPTSTWNSSAFSFDIPETLPTAINANSSGYLLPGNLNNENYDHSNQLTDISIGLGEGSYCNGEFVDAYLNIEGEAPQGYWSNGDFGSETQFEVRQGSNTIYYYATNAFGCDEVLSKTFEAGPYSQVSLNATQYEICPKKGKTIISYEVQFQDPRNEVEFAIWTKDGELFSNAYGGIIVTEPGEYCIEIIDVESGCTSEKVCVSIEEGPCQDLDPAFNFVKTVGQTAYTINVTSVETRTCHTSGWWVTDITDPSNKITVSEGWFYSGALSNTTFQIGRIYEIKHGVESDCQGWTQSIRTVSQMNRFKSPTVLDGKVDSDLTIYPNPATNVLFVKTNSVYDNYVLFNAIGEKVFQGSDSEISLEGLNNGMYFISFFDIGGTLLESKKFIKN